MIRILLVLCMLAFGGAVLVGCGGDGDKQGDGACTDCKKSEGKMCAPCQKKMWAETSQKCEACKKAGEGNVCADCQKIAMSDCAECKKGGKTCAECSKKDGK
jgi:hypothetical protein